MTMALDCFFGDVNWTRAAKRRYLEHEAMVRGIVPAERLLVFDVRDGWEPLCKFLGKPVPDEPFPNGNAGPEFFERAAKLMRDRDTTAYRNMALTTGVVVAAIAVTARWIRGGLR